MTESDCDDGFINREMSDIDFDNDISNIGMTESDCDDDINNTEMTTVIVMMTSST